MGSCFSSRPERVDRTMVRLARQDTTAIYVVLDDERPIGQVVAPAGEPLLGPGEGTVLLRRVTRVAGQAAA
jgi:hypothetical protein